MFGKSWDENLQKYSLERKFCHLIQRNSARLWFSLSPLPKSLILINVEQNVPYLKLSETSALVSFTSLVFTAQLLHLVRQSRLLNRSDERLQRNKTPHLMDTSKLSKRLVSMQISAANEHLSIRPDSIWKIPLYASYVYRHVSIRVSRSWWVTYRTRF